MREEILPHPHFAASFLGLHALSGGERGGGLVRRTVVLVALIVWLTGPAHADDKG